MMDYKQDKKEGNECIIHKTVSILPLADKWAVVVLMKCVGNWFNTNDLAQQIETFDTEEEARIYYDNYSF
jgi:hypothetical protein